MNRDLLSSSSEGSNYTADDGAIRVNIYGANGAFESEIDTIYETTKDFLGELYLDTDLTGYSIYSYETDAQIEMDADGKTRHERHNELIQQGYDAIGNSEYDDEHAVVIWVYWDHSSDSSDCGGEDPCPDTFAMGHDVSYSSSYQAWFRQPYVYRDSPDLYDIHQAFVYENRHEKESDGIAGAHELGHVLITHDAAEVKALTPDREDQETGEHDDHYLGRSFDFFGETYNTIMAHRSLEAVTNEKADCYNTESYSEIRTATSSCTRDSIGYSIDYFIENT